MASYDGYLEDDAMVSEYFRGIVLRPSPQQFKMFSAWEVTTTKAFSGSASLKLFTGGIYTLDVAVDSGSRTLTLQAWAPINGVARIDILDPDTEEVLASDATLSSKTWEELSVSWTATPKVYLLLLRHMGQSQQVEGEDPNCYFDVIEVV